MTQFLKVWIKGVRRFALDSFFHLTIIFSLFSLPALATSPIALVQRAHNLKLAEQTEWLRLGHWQKTFHGYVSEVDGPDFFLAPNGKTDPEAELVATLNAFAQNPFGPENSNAQCRFMARRSWLFEELKIDQQELAKAPCQERSQWKKKLDADGVSLIFASSFMNNAASMFGHTFLKIHTRTNNDDRDLLNYGVSFLARTGNDDNEASPLYGLVGAYPGFFTMSPFHETLREYTHLDGRDVWEYRLNLSVSETDHLIDHLLELQQTYFNYYFISKNCAYQLLAAIEVARPELQLKRRLLWQTIPADVIRLIAEEPGLVTSIHYRPSLTTIFRTSQEPLTQPELRLVKDLAHATPKDLERLNELATERRALVLDSAIAYVDLLQIRHPEGFKGRAYQLKIFRAQTGVIHNERDSTPDATRPEQGHDPARIGLGFGNRGANSFSEVQYRFAYQNLLSDDTGYLGNTQLEALRFSVRRYSQAPGLTLEDATLLDIISLAPVDRFFTPLSWRFNVAYAHLPDRPENEAAAGSINGGVGYSYLPFRGHLKDVLTLFTFAQLHGDLGAGLSSGYRFGSSLQVQAILKPSRWLRINAGFEERDYFIGATSTFPASWLKASVSASRNIELDASFGSVNSITATNFMIYYHHLL